MAFWDFLRRILAPAPGAETPATPSAQGDGADAPFMVLVAPIDGDDGTIGRMLSESLGAVAGLTVVATASPGAVDRRESPPVSLARAAKRARAQAEHAAARCVLWGAVEDGLLTLWVVPAELETEPPGCAVMAGDAVVLPAALPEALPLAVVATLAALPLDSDAQRARRLEQLRAPLAQADALLQDDRLGAQAKPAAALIYAGALAEIGWRAGQRPLLEKAIEVQQAALAKAREAAGEDETAGPLGPCQTAAARARLGDLLADIGGRDKDAEKIQRAVALYRKALAVYALELLPEEHARVSAQMGRACHRLAHLTGKSAWMREAIAAYRDTCRVWTKAAHPERWAEMQHGIGTLLGQMGEFTGKKEVFERAAKVLTGVMEVWTRETHPRRWAGVHNNIGACRFAEGKLNGEIPPLRDALEHFSYALEVYEQLAMTRNIHVTQKNISRVERLISVQESRG